MWYTVMLTWKEKAMIKIKVNKKSFGKSGSTFDAEWTAVKSEEELAVGQEVDEFFK